MRRFFLQKITGKFFAVKERMREIAIRTAARRARGFFFIQIGACDGCLCDPIRKYILEYGWSGIFVEPVRYLFERLKKNYGSGEHFVFENAAIAEKSGTARIYRYKEDEAGLPDWCEGTASLVNNFHSRHRAYISDIESRLVTEEVNCITFSELIARHKVTKVDLLQIDVEGYEWTILKDIDFATLRPKIINFEHICLSPEDRARAVQMLKKEGYRIFCLDNDTFAFLETGYIEIFVQLFSYALTRLMHGVPRGSR